MPACSRTIRAIRKMDDWRRKSTLGLKLTCLCFLLLSALPCLAGAAEDSVARQWNEELLAAIRKDLARPTVHARNLFHVSAAMWDAFAAYDAQLETLQHHEQQWAADLQTAREEAISYAAYGLLKWRFASSPGAAQSLPSFEQRMSQLGYDSSFTSLVGDTPAALGNRIAQTYIEFGLADHSNEQNAYENQFYEPVNEPLVPDLPGNPDMSNPNRWQALALDFFEDQGGNVLLGGYPGFLSPEWGTLTPFALQPGDLTLYQRDGNDYWVYHDPGPPPLLGGMGDAQYKAGFEQVVLWSGLLDPGDGVMIDISPASNGNNPLGTNDGVGYEKNPVTGLPYTPDIVPAGDYYRVLAEFWADGPDSETPPGHWFTIAHYVSDHPQLEKRFRGQGRVLDDLEWDVKLFLALGGAMHDVAVAVWGTKGWYDYVRPISAIRYMCDRGQSSEPDGPSYHPEGISLYPGSVEVITAETAALGGRHFPLGGNINEHHGKIAVRAWRGPDYIPNPDTDAAGVGWIRCENWWPYQRPSFVTPPFAGYVSGHSTFSRAAAVVLSRFTGSEFFPGGLGTFEAPKNEFLVFEEGPSVDITLQWASYFDAADETSLSRIYGGIHPIQDDIPGRLMGAEMGADAFFFASKLFGDDSSSSRATFKVRKFFADGNDVDEALVVVRCNTGLILDQAKSLAGGESVEFVVAAFSEGKLDCMVTEESPLAYAAEYNNTSLNLQNQSSCSYPEVRSGDAYECEITNLPLPVDVQVNKVWQFEGSVVDVDMSYTLTLYCDALIEGGQSLGQGPWQSPGQTPGQGSEAAKAGCGPITQAELAAGSSPANLSWCKAFAGRGNKSFTAAVIPAFPSSSCWWLESGQDPLVLVDQSNCNYLTIRAGSGAACTITNTVFFEGIPVFNKFGMLMLVSLMLTAGGLGFRRMG